MIRILIADDHAIVRSGLTQLFSMASDIEVVSLATDGRQVIEFLHRGSCDLILLDLTMPGISGIDLIASIRGHKPKLPILVLSMHNEPLIARRALKAGAAGYMTKDSEPEMVIAAIRKVAGGGRYIDPRLAEQIVFDSETGNPEQLHEQLSNRELNIFNLLVRGKSVNEIAVELAISNKTVSTHKARLMQKMRFQSNAELMRYGLDHGLGY